MLTQKDENTVHLENCCFGRDTKKLKLKKLQDFELF